MSFGAADDRAILDCIPGAVVLLSSDLRVLDGTRALASLAGRPIDEIIGASFDVVLTGSSRILFQTHVYPALTAGGRVDEVFLTVARPDGGSTPVLFNAVRREGARSRVFDALMVPIQARARWETELLEATRALERERTASQQLADDLTATAQALAARRAEEERAREFRDAFFGVVSHELRTPITTIYGMSHLLAERFDSMEPAQVRQELDDIHLEADRLRRLTEDLLVLSRAEGDRLTVDAEPVVIASSVRNVIAAERARSESHRFVLDMPPGLPLVLGEELYVEQVIGNFLSNASKYSPVGSTVTISVQAEAGGVAVRVIDEGAGLPDGPPDRLFELFYRAPGAVRQASGAGIGLFVCRQLVEAMGGRIWARPAPSPARHGAEFGCWLRAAPIDEVDLGSIR